MKPSSIRFAMFLVCCVMAFLIFSNQGIRVFFGGLDQIGYLAALAAGMFLAFGFTLPFSIGALVNIHPGTIWIAALLAGFACLVSNLFVYHFMRHSFMDKFDKMRRLIVLRDFHSSFDTNKFQRFLVYTGCSFYGLLIAFPLSDKFENQLITGMREIDYFYLAFIGFIVNLIIIFLLLLL
jgi:hypothetical protein